MRHLIQPTDFSLDELDSLFALAEIIMNNKMDFIEACKGKIMASLFFEPSTRTKFSFDAAMLRLGGGVIGFSDPSTTSAQKGESLADTARMIASYADIIVTRSPREGAPLLMAKNSTVPVINAGDGVHHHPTQTLADMMTIKHLKNRFSNLVFGFCGDLKFGRTVHSLFEALSRYEGNRFVFISPSELMFPEHLIAGAQNGSQVSHSVSLEGSINQLDILYMTRVQKERFVSEEEYLRLKDFFILDERKMAMAKKDMAVMHPLPRTNELSTEVDSDPRSAYFLQAELGMYVRMALILKLFEWNEASEGKSI
ncbi:MAG: aspartate carbamoyltransferase [Eubacteriaceae bacterium]|nr:aspartate carbamoyltransferase [Eubacteriaceae bacterium]